LALNHDFNQPQRQKKLEITKCKVIFELFEKMVCVFVVKITMKFKFIKYNITTILLISAALIHTHTLGIKACFEAAVKLSPKALPTLCILLSATH